MAIQYLSGKWHDLMCLIRKDCKYMPIELFYSYYSYCIKYIYLNSQSININIEKSVYKENAIKFAYKKVFKPLKNN